MIKHLESGLIIDTSKTISDVEIKEHRENLEWKLNNGNFKTKKSRQLSFGKNGGMY